MTDDERELLIACSRLAISVAWEKFSTNEDREFIRKIMDIHDKVDLPRSGSLKWPEKEEASKPSKSTRKQKAS
jgi:hypothetical protein